MVASILFRKRIVGVFSDTDKQSAFNSRASPYFFTASSSCPVFCRGWVPRFARRFPDSKIGLFVLIKLEDNTYPDDDQQAPRARDKG
jgi:hypothetical protein